MPVLFLLLCSGCQGKGGQASFPFFCLTVPYSECLVAGQVLTALLTMLYSASDTLVSFQQLGVLVTVTGSD